MSLRRKRNSEDYVLVGPSAGVEVKNLWVLIHRTDEGVVVDIFPKGAEDEPVASTYAFFGEAGA